MSALMYFAPVTRASMSPSDSFLSVIFLMGSGIKNVDIRLLKSRNECRYRTLVSKSVYNSLLSKCIIGRR